ncbi:hypothetical protein BC343_13490 [Mucilaginibacter pedocola]|uniref:Uncharacterized protein n=1 Tax=Mucilaginibacter pedocola TaxID=1792845 RepID=A0A1S9P9X7_9SPHI|nr:hypothetical protein BC343_13490 [Mucilaginibacter pedocola]
MPAKLFVLLILLLCPTFVFCQADPVRLTFENGQIKGSFKSPGGEKVFVLDATIPSTYKSTSAQVLSADSTHIVIKKHIEYFKNSCDITSTVKRTAYGLQWDIDITTNDTGSWTVPIETSLKWVNPDSARFWTAWAGNQPNAKTDAWQDPFLSAPFSATGANLWRRNAPLAQCLCNTYCKYFI